MRTNIRETVGLDEAGDTIRTYEMTYSRKFGSMGSVEFTVTCKGKLELEWFIRNSLSEISISQDSSDPFHDNGFGPSSSG